jgi:hypothetical protein
MGAVNAKMMTSGTRRFISNLRRRAEAVGWRVGPRSAHHLPSRSIRKNRVLRRLSLDAHKSRLSLSVRNGTDLSAVPPPTVGRATEPTLCAAFSSAVNSKRAAGQLGELAGSRRCASCSGIALQRPGRQGRLHPRGGDARRRRG